MAQRRPLFPLLPLQVPGAMGTSPLFCLLILLLSTSQHQLQKLHVLGRQLGLDLWIVHKLEERRCQGNGHKLGGPPEW